ncbi:DUF2794 domain-containing protein [Lichenifustis flavocetrariae]|uniref:DUF2794 domain-containing protein n=1 Tax=Lichenifustis flavocetrariae TaxID=2949735 RepID=UPI003D12BAA0
MTINEAPENGDQQTRMDSRAAVHPFPSRQTPEPNRREGAVVSFDRHELREILNVYGRGIANGDWKDYALDFTPQKSVFSIYRRASEVPLYRIEKDPALARKQGAYAVVNAAGFVLKRGPELARVLRVLETKPRLSVV